MLRLLPALVVHPRNGHGEGRADITFPRAHTGRSWTSWNSAIGLPNLSTVQGHERAFSYAPHGVSGCREGDFQTRLAQDPGGVGERIRMLEPEGFIEPDVLELDVCILNRPEGCGGPASRNRCSSFRRPFRSRCWGVQVFGVVGGEFPLEDLAAGPLRQLCHQFDDARVLVGS